VSEAVKTLSMAQAVEPKAVEPTPVENVPEFYIPATESIGEAWPRILKHNDTFAMFDHHGDIVNAEGNPAGLFHRDTRHLSGFYILIDDHRPLLLSSTVQDDNAALTADLANPDIYRGTELVLSRETLHLIRTKFLFKNACHERISVQNFDLKEHSSQMLVRFDADFADLFEARGIKRERHGVRTVTKEDGSTILFRYLGLDGVTRLTRVRFDPAPTRLDNHQALYDVTLAPQERKSAFITVTFGRELPQSVPNFGPAMRAARRNLRVQASQAAAVSSSNEMLNQMLCRSVSDLSMLVTQTPQGPYPYAGIPWFSTAFGRDGIITALETLWLDPGIAKGVLQFLAATQAREVDARSDAEPGKILHETRHGEMANTGEVPFGLYYGSVDATPLFVLLAGKYFERTGDLETVSTIWPNIEAALEWIATYGDRDKDGFVEYQRQSETGLGNQGWKDSNDSIMHADGSLAQGPIALCEVQGYVYSAKLAAAKIARAMGRDGAEKLEAEAENLRLAFEDKFWCDDLGAYALALDGQKRPCAVIASNTGHALFSGIASPERAKRVADVLMRRDAFSGWGVRTLACNQKRYNPMSYHDGSVWPHDNAMIALGFARYRLREPAMEIFTGMFDAVHYMELQRLPELFCGFARRHGTAPTLYPVACSPQAWASAAPFAFLEACLGLTCDYAAGEIRFENPTLPEFITSLCIRRLKLGDSEVDVELHRHEGNVAVNVLRRSGNARVVVWN
jgi:glycogen debranching enzyme